MLITNAARSDLLAELAADPDLSWQQVTGSRTWVLGVNDLATTSNLPNGNNEIIIPPAGELWLVRGLMLHQDASDPLTAAGAFSQLRISATDYDVISTTLTTYGRLALPIKYTNANFTRGGQLLVPGIVSTAGGGGKHRAQSGNRKRRCRLSVGHPALGLRIQAHRERALRGKGREP